MKARKVVVTFEIVTDVKLSELKKFTNWDFEAGYGFLDIKQIQANVIKDDD